MIAWTDTMWRPLRHTDFSCHSLKPQATAADPQESSSGSLGEERRELRRCFYVDLTQQW